MRLNGFKTIFLALLSAIIISGCGGSSNGGEDQQQVIQSIELRGDFSLECGEADCPESIGMVISLIKEGETPNRCTGFLVSENHLMTNFHCLPEKAKQVGASCEGLLSAVFLKDGSQIKVECEKVISASGLPSEENSMQDFAVIKLKNNLEINPAKINYGPRSSGDKVTIYKINPIDSVRAILKSTSCELKANTPMGESFDGPRTSLVHTLGCETVSGNSGAPLFNEKNEVIAIHQSSLKNTGRIKESFASILSEGDFLELGTATNFGCLCREENNFFQCSKLPTTCREAGPEFSDLKRDKILAEAFKIFVNVNRAYKDFLNEARFLSNNYEWEITFGTYITINGASAFMTTRPKCIVDKKEFERGSQRFVQNGINERNRTIVLEDIPMCKLQFKVNKKHEIVDLKFNLADCTRGKSFLDYNVFELKNRSMLAYFGFYKDTFQEVGSPFGRVLTIEQCQNE